MWLLPVAVSAAACLATAPAVLAATQTPPQGGIAQVPASFTVTNTNTSKSPCNASQPGQPDGHTYTVHGHLSGPASLFAARHASTVTVYLTGFEVGEWNWDLNVPSYDHAAEMARLGQVSLTLDELGYGTSVLANGEGTCQGAEADMIHQIVGQLHTGTYTLGDGSGISFGSAVLAGHDVGGQVAEIEAYSYTDIAALIVLTYADQGVTPFIVQRNATAGLDWCPPSSDGYVHYVVSNQEWAQLLFYDAEPQVVDTTAGLREPNPCGLVQGTASAVVADKAYTPSIHVPVLIVFGNNDTLVWTKQGQEQQQDNFTGTTDKTTVFIPEAGHFPMFEKTAPQFRQVISDWLQRHSW